MKRLILLLLASSCLAQQGLRDPGFVASLNRSAASPTFSPTDIGGMFAWYDAPANSSIGDGNPVTQITDSSGNGKDLFNSTGANRAIWDVDAANGQPAFVYTSDLTTNANWLMGHTNQFIFWVIRQDVNAGATGRRMITQANGITTDTTETGHHIPIRFNAANTNWGTFAETSYRGLQRFTNGVWTIGWQRYDNVTITNFANGNPVGYVLSTPPWQPNFNYLSIGGMINGAGQHEGFSLHTWICYTNFPTASEITSLIAWGADRIGIPIP